MTLNDLHRFHCHCRPGPLPWGGAIDPACVEARDTVGPTLVALRAEARDGLLLELTRRVLVLERTLSAVGIQLAPDPPISTAINVERTIESERP